jgi:hypothetical protein
MHGPIATATHGNILTPFTIIQLDLNFFQKKKGISKGEEPVTVFIFSSRPPSLCLSVKLYIFFFFEEEKMFKK